MMNALIALGLGIIVFALIVATGLVVMSNFGTATANCPTDYSYNTNGTSGILFTTNTCCLSNTTDNDACVGGLNTTPASDATGTMQTMMGYMESNLITWIPAVIALGIGLLFIGALMGKRNY